LKKSKFKNVTGKQIREARVFHDPPISQTSLAKCTSKYGVQLDQGAISRIESRSRNLSDYELIAIARCLGVTVDSLVGAKGQD
jgi:HTH-type transcriptional regulator, cell division transcriptional repressor